MNQLIPGFTNVYEENIANPYDEVRERNYLLSILQHLQKLMGYKFQDLDFYLFSSFHFSNEETPSSGSVRTGRPKVLLFVSEEYANIPIPLMDKFFIIFKAYLPHDRSKTNIYPLPLGHAPRFYRQSPLPWEQRSLNVFFSGQINSARYMGLYRSLSNLRFLPSSLQVRLPEKVIRLFGQNFSKRFKNSKIVFNKKHGGVLPLNNYQELLFKSKIALCPKGSISAETKRHFEAAAAGCIIISEKLPDTYLYRNSPIIQIDNWRKDIKVIKTLLNDPEQQLRLHQQTVSWYQNHFHPAGAALYLKKKIEKQCFNQEKKTQLRSDLSVKTSK